MAEPKQTINERGLPVHYSVGAVIEINGRFLLIDRNMEPFGFAAIAGHIEKNESPEEAIRRKVLEESGLQVKNFSLLFKELIPWNLCRAGVSAHYWHVYKCAADGVVKHNADAAKSIGWHSAKEMKNLEWEPVWKHWFEKLGVLT